MLLRTTRLTLRPWTVEDAEAFHRLYSEPEVLRYLGNTKPTESVEEARARLEVLTERYRELGEQGFFFWALSDAEGICGGMLYKPIPWSKHHPEDKPKDVEIGWHLHPSVWGRGYATEAGQAILAHAKGRVVAVADPENPASVRVMERLGMRQVGLTEEYYDAEVMLYEWNPSNRP